ncbi:uncharacterized protein B0P05DRAFT_542627 [Gilbertella persicaria]|uniref:uncharacterized protein n=1 Tax=Gilbertella persicaria TaxID=101096 RepID=UPI00221F8AEE|nr:uncharacterized protein B0P05DRAFT_542627 [Gilbertella persicaria]KAI8078131.1 hypothetical protein B0P05DRAFT_542627 [Gilbertella persicaria]
MPKLKVTKKPVVSGISPKLTISLIDCNKRKINPVLSGLKVEHWTNNEKLVKQALKNNNKQVSKESITRMILEFFASVTTSFATNIGLSKYSKACRSYFLNPKNKADLQKVVSTQLKLMNLGKQNQKIIETTHNLRSKSKLQKNLANAAKEYQTAKYEADVFLKALDVDSSDSSSEDDGTVELQTPLTQSAIEESDNVFTTENQAESVGKRIKQEAVNIHNEYVKGVDVGTQAKLVMELGLSSILDLTHNEDAYQKYIFSNQEWKQLEDYFNKKYKLKTTTTIPKTVIDTWSTVAQLATRKGAFVALKYIAKIQSLESTSEVNYIFLEILKHIVLVLHQDTDLINGIIENNGSISEQDVYALWFPIIKKIISMKKIIRMKQGETTNLYTTKRKQAQYFDHEKVKGFKIDARLLVDYGRNEIDLCAGEVAVNTHDADKLIHDRSKFIREAKEICDRHMEAGLGRDSVGWGIQICGLEARLVSVHLFREGLFVAVCQNRFRFPQNIKELPEFIDTLKGLVYLIERNESEAIKLIGLYDKINRSYNSSLNGETSSNRSDNGKMTTLSTYYTPPLGERNKSIIPPQLFRKRKRQLFHERVIIGEDNSKSAMLETKGAADMFGWVEMDDNTWYNTVTGEKSDISPYEE